MALTGGSAKGKVGDVVAITFTVRTAGVPRYDLIVPLVRGGAQYLGDCPNGGEPQGYCWVPYETGGAVDTRVLRFKILQTGTVRVEVNVSAKGVTDPEWRNDKAFATITGIDPAARHDMALTGGSAKGKVGDIVTVTVKIRTSGVPRYVLWVARDQWAHYVGRCDEVRDAWGGACLIYLERKGEVDTFDLKFKVTKLGKVPTAPIVYPDGSHDPNLRDNTADVVIEGVPASGGGGGGDDGGDGGDLPTTGTPVAAITMGGAALLIAGLVLFGVARRRGRTARQH